LIKREESLTKENEELVRKIIATEKYVSNQLSELTDIVNNHEIFKAIEA